MPLAEPFSLLSSSFLTSSLHPLSLYPQASLLPFVRRRYSSLSHQRQPNPLIPPPTLARTILYLPASFTREDPPVRLLPSLLRPLSPSFTPPLTSFSIVISSSSSEAFLRGITSTTLLFWTEASSWHSLGAARSTGKVALGASTTCAARQIKGG